MIVNNLLVLDLVSDTDVEVRTQALILSCRHQVVESNEPLLEVLSLHVRQPCQHQLKDGNKVWLQSLNWDVCDDSIDQLECMSLMSLGGNKLLEDTEDRLQLLICNNTLGIASDHGTEQASKRRNVTTLVPDSTLNDDREQTSVVIGQLTRRVGFQQRREKLEDVWREFFNVLRQTCSKWLV